MVGRSTLAPGEVFAGYTIDRVLGAGGMATVYLAAHPRLPRRVALKLLHPELTRDDYVRSRFELEAEQVARLEHPNIVDVHDRGREGDQLWIAMQYVDGASAGDAIGNSGAMAAGRAVFIVTETAKALDYAHRNGVLHRDVKPDNILLERDSRDRRGRVLLADFGIAKALTETTHLTQTGMMVASLQYAAPEQFEGRALDARTDVYSLGCTLFHLLTGQIPYAGSSMAELMRAHLVLPVPRPGAIRPELSPGWDAVFGRALAKNPDDRYPSCGALAADAARVIAEPHRYAGYPGMDLPAPVAETRPAWLMAPAGRPPQVGPAPSRPPSWRRLLPALAGVVVVAAGVIVGVIVYNSGDDTPTPVQPAEHHQRAAPVQTVLPFSGLNEPNGMAVDSAGNVYVVDERNNRVLELAAGSTTQQTLPFTGLNGPLQVAVD
ncbi:MAG: protein kinase domain-containing protein, partial [Mycobacterium sp.]